MAKGRKALIAVVLLVLCAAPAAWADVVAPSPLADPELLRIGTGSGTTCAMGGCFVYNNNTQVNFLGNNVTSLGVFYQSQGQGNDPILNPFLLIVGVVNGNQMVTPPNISGVSMGSTTGSGQIGGSGGALYGLTWNATTGYAGTFTSSMPPQGGVYQLLGSPYGSPSQNWTNWSGVSSFFNNIVATSFDIYVYTLTVTPSQISPGGIVDVSFSAPLPNGSMVIAFGCSSVLTDGTCDNKSTYATPFTQSGITGPPGPPIPEPSTLALFGTGLLGLGGLLRRRLRS